MDSVPGDQWLAEYARWIQIHEARLGDVGRRVVSGGNREPAGNPGGASQPTSSAFWKVVSLGAAGMGAANAPKPFLLKLNPHYLYYLLIRFEAITLPVGPLDVNIPAAARPTTSFSYVSSHIPKDKGDTMSLSSIRTGISVVSSSLSSASSWFTSTPVRQDPNRDVKYLYSSFTKIPNLRLGPIPARKLIQDFEDSPGQMSVPLDVFKNLQLLELDDVDPRTIIGWDRLCIQLRSLTCKRSSVEDLSHLLVDLVVNDDRRRRGERGVRSKASSTPAEVPDIDALLPSHAWDSLRHLNMSCNNLTFVPPEPLLRLSRLTHLDLSSNLLNLVPPSLSQLTSLTSLNISDNLIDSVLGIYETLKGIRVLNIAKNRLESLCGLERLYTLERIDLRGNSIYEAGEVGRLSTLPRIKEVWIRENPLVEELVDYRVECFVEFAREHRTITLDGETPGFFEKQRIAERVPSQSIANSPQAQNTRAAKADVEEEQEARLANDMTTVVKNVRHRGPSGSSFAHPSSKTQSSIHAHAAGKSGSSLQTKSKTDVNKRRNQRLVELDTSPTKPVSKSGNARATTAQSGMQAGTVELSDSEVIKQAAQSGNSASALESPDPKRNQPAGLAKTASNPSAGPLNGKSLTWSRKAGASAAALCDQSSTSESSPAATDPQANTKNVEAVPTCTSEADGASTTRSEALRKKIEALKSEVGDDWLRVLSRGDAAHLAQERMQASDLTQSESHTTAAHAPTPRSQTRKTRRDAQIT